MAQNKLNRRLKIKKRIRGKISGTSQKPRMSVYRSNKQIYVQLIDDVEGKTIASVSSKLKEASTDSNKIDQAKAVGKLIAQKSKEAGVAEVVFDRNGYLYHGRIKALADAAREEGLKL